MLLTLFFGTVSIIAAYYLYKSGTLTLEKQTHANFEKRLTVLETPKQPVSVNCELVSLLAQLQRELDADPGKKPAAYALSVAIANLRVEAAATLAGCFVANAQTSRGVPKTNQP
jgi:hypothetical protein